MGHNTEVDERDFEALAKEIMADPVARAAAIENGLRRGIGAAFDLARERKKMTVRELADASGVKISQTQRALHQEVGGKLDLNSLVRIADALGLEIKIEINEKE